MIHILYVCRLMKCDTAKKPFKLIPRQQLRVIITSHQQILVSYSLQGFYPKLHTEIKQVWKVTIASSRIVAKLSPNPQLSLAKSALFCCYAGMSCCSISLSCCCISITCWASVKLLQHQPREVLFSANVHPVLTELETLGILCPSAPFPRGRPKYVSD